MAINIESEKIIEGNSLILSPGILNWWVETGSAIPQSSSTAADIVLKISKEKDLLDISWNTNNLHWIVNLTGGAFSAAMRDFNQQVYTSRFEIFNLDITKQNGTDATGNFTVKCSTTGVTDDGFLFVKGTASHSFDEDGYLIIRLHPLANTQENTYIYYYYWHDEIPLINFFISSVTPPTFDSIEYPTDNQLNISTIEHHYNETIFDSIGRFTQGLLFKPINIANYSSRAPYGLSLICTKNNQNNTIAHIYNGTQTTDKFKAICLKTIGTDHWSLTELADNDEVPAPETAQYYLLGFVQTTDYTATELNNMSNGGSSSGQSSTAGSPFITVVDMLY